MMPKWCEKLPLDVIKAEARKAGINWALIAATCEKESAGCQWAMRYEKAWKYFYKIDEHAVLCGVTAETEEQMQKFSYGLGQIMGSVARELGFSLPLGKLCDPVVNIHYCVLKYKKLLEKYPLLPDAIASYNAGSPRKAPNGSYVNQSYVSDVLRLIGQIPLEKSA